MLTKNTFKALFTLKDRSSSFSLIREMSEGQRVLAKLRLLQNTYFFLRQKIPNLLLNM
jgi:hypothetical protein